MERVLFLPITSLLFNWRLPAEEIIGPMVWDPTSVPIHGTGFKDMSASVHRKRTRRCSAARKGEGTVQHTTSSECFPTRLACFVRVENVPWVFELCYHWTTSSEVRTVLKGADRRSHTNIHDFLIRSAVFKEIVVLITWRLKTDFTLLQLIRLLETFGIHHRQNLSQSM